MGSSGTFCGYTHVFQAREDKYDQKMVATLPRLGLPTRQNPRWPPFYRKIAKIAIKYVLIDLE